ncbi:MAG: hypothetical protein OEV77_04810, partial [Nitrospira sp.]|nr:hypothetical protein [Nitrospira sp.]
STYDAVILWILTTVVKPGRQILADFWRQVVRKIEWSTAVHGEYQQMVPISSADPLRRLGSRHAILRSRRRHGERNLTGVVLASRRSRAFLD